MTTGTETLLFLNLITLKKWRSLPWPLSRTRRHQIRFELATKQKNIFPLSGIETRYLDYRHNKYYNLNNISRFVITLDQLADIYQHTHPTKSYAQPI
jgi:hypothetical protein